MSSGKHCYPNSDILINKLFDEVQNDSGMEKLWKSYQKKFSYAKDISWEMVMESVQEVYCMSKE